MHINGSASECAHKLAFKGRSALRCKTMNQIWNKIALLLLPVFFAATVVSLPGYAWCFGDDGHVEIEYISGSDCADDACATNLSDTLSESTFSQPDEDHCGPCLDLDIQLNDATTTKRLENKAPVTLDAIAITSLPSPSAQTVKMVVGNLVPQPPPRIAQSILNHRTVVLLN